MLWKFVLVLGQSVMSFKTRNQTHEQILSRQFKYYTLKHCDWTMQVTWWVLTNQSALYQAGIEVIHRETFLRFAPINIYQTSYSSPIASSCEYTYFKWVVHIINLVVILENYERILFPNFMQMRRGKWWIGRGQPTLCTLGRRRSTTPQEIAQDSRQEFVEQKI